MSDTRRQFLQQLAAGTLLTGLPLTAKATTVPVADRDHPKYDIIMRVQCFDRWLDCPKCGHSVRLADWTRPLALMSDGKIASIDLKCQKCRHYGIQRIRDIPQPTYRPARFRLSQTEIIHDDFTGELQFLWQPPECLQMVVRGAGRHVLAGLDWNLITAILHNERFVLNNANIVYAPLH